MKTKVCKKCGKRKTLDKFSKREINSKEVYHAQCKNCMIIYNKQYQKTNKEKINQQKRKYYQAHIKKVKEYQKQYKQLHKQKLDENRKKYYHQKKKKLLKQNKKYYLKNKELILKRCKKYYQKNKQKILKRVKYYYRKNKKKIINYNVKYRKQRRKNNIDIRLKDRLSKRIWDAVKKNRKSKKTMKLVGCSVKQLKKHLQKQFKKGMTWDNYGFYGWHIDHIKPCCSFDLSKASEQRKCFNYKNLQPLWAEENWSKNDIGR